MVGLDKTDRDMDSTLWSHIVPGAEPGGNSELKRKKDSYRNRKRSVVVIVKVHATCMTNFI